MTKNMTRRDVIKTAGAVLTVSQYGAASAAVVPFILGYTDKNTYYPGDVVQIRLNSSVDTKVAGSIYPSAVTTGWQLVSCYDSSVIAVGSVTVQPSVIAPADQDQNWPLTMTLQLSSTIKPGVYKFLCDNSSWGTAFYFCIRNIPASRAEMVVVIPTNTFQAYTYYGGKSLYAYNSSNGVNSNKVSFNRPMTFVYYNSATTGMIDLINWLMNNYSCDVVTDRELHLDSSLLLPYKCMITVDHSEYWSRQMRNNVQAYLQVGGNIAVLSGNNMWWCVRDEDQGTSMFCSRTSDGSNDPNPDKTITWYLKGWSTKAQLGCGFEHGAASTDTPNPLKPVPATVYGAGHWIFDCTNVSNGDQIGVQENVAVYEVDGVELDVVNGSLRVKPNSGTDPSFTILTSANVNSWTSSPPKNWTMGCMNTGYGGKVFNAATVNWHSAFKSQFIAETNKSPLVTMTDNFLRACVNTQLIEFSTPNPVKDPLSPNAFNGYMYMYLTESRISQLSVSTNNNLRSVFLSNYTWTETGGRLNLPIVSRPGAIPLYKHRKAVMKPGSRLTIYKEVLTFSSTPADSTWTNEGRIAYAFASKVTGSRPVYLFSDSRILGVGERISVRNKQLANETLSSVPKFYCY